MEQKTNTLSVPYSYARCYNEQCRQAENCLRRMAALYDTADYHHSQSGSLSESGWELFLFSKSGEGAYGMGSQRIT